MLQNNHRLPAESIACLRLEIHFQIKKLWSKWWFYTVCKKGICNSVTSKVWKKSRSKWVSERAIKVYWMLLYRYKVTKHIFCEHIFVYLWPNRQNTVWNIGKCNSVTFCKSFRMFSFLDTMLMWGIFHLYLSVAKSKVRKGVFATFYMIGPII